MPVVPFSGVNTVSSDGGAAPYQDEMKTAVLDKAFGGGIPQVAEALGDEFQTVNEAQGKAEALQATSQADLDMQNKMVQAQQSAQPGAPMFAKDFGAMHNQYYQNLLANTDNPYAKQIIEQHQQASARSFGDAAINFQVGQQTNLIHQNTLDGINNVQNSFQAMAPQDADAQYQPQLDRINGVIDSQPLTPDKKEALKQVAAHGLRQAILTNYTQNNAQQFLQQVSGTRDPQEIQLNSTNPVGVQNNNPGNLRGDDAWQGKTGQDGKGFVQFDTPQSGIRALSLDLLNKNQTDGLSTVSQIVSKFAPASDGNDVPAYVKAVSSDVGVSPDANIDLADPKMLQKVTTAVIKHENGSVHYSDDMISQGVNAALGKDTPAPATTQVASDDNAGVQTDASDTTPDATTDPAQGAPKTGISAFDNATYKERQKAINQAEQSVRKDTIANASALKGRMADGLAMAQRGVPDPNPIQQPEFAAAGMDKVDFANYQKDLNVATTINKTNLMTPTEMQAAYSSVAPQPGEGFADDQKNQDAVGKAILSVQSARQKDPTQWAQNAGLIPTTPLDTTNGQNFSQQIQDRGDAVSQISSKYGTAPNPFSIPEAKQLASQLAQASTMQQLSILKSVTDNLDNPTVLRAGLAQIAPDNPVAAQAGGYMAADKPLQVDNPANHGLARFNSSIPATIGMDGTSVAALAVAGQNLIQPNKASMEEDGKGKGIPLPADTNDIGKPGLRNSFDNAARGGSTDGATSDIFAGMPQNAEQSYKTYKAIYAALSDQAGDHSGALNQARADQAAKLTLGDIANINNKAVAPPWGMSATDFTDAAKSHYDAIASTVPGAPAFSGVQLQNMDAPGLYTIKAGTGTLMKDATHPVIIDINQPVAKPTAPTTTSSAVPLVIAPKDGAM